MTADARPQSTRLAILVPFAIVTLIWGSTWLVITGQIARVPGLWSVSYRFAIAGVAMLAYAAWRRERVPRDAPGLAFAAATGLFQFVGNYNLVYLAEARITSGLVAVVFALLLVPNALLGRLVLGQRLGRQLLAGSTVAMAGVTLLILHQARVDPGGPHATLVGAALTLGAIGCASIANVMQGTEVAKRYPMVATLGLAMLIGSACDALLAWRASGPPVIDPTPGYWLGVVYLALAGSAVSFPLYYRVLRVIGPAKAAYSSVTVPVVAMTLSTLFEGYRWSVLAGAGAGLTAAGLVIALSARRPNR